MTTPRRPQPALSSAPIPSLRQVASAAVTLGALLGSTPASAAEPTAKPSEPPEPPEPTAEAREEARTHFRFGRVLAAAGDLNGAIRHLDTSCALEPNPNALFLLAELKLRAGDEMGALEAFEKYLALGDEPGSAGRRDIAEQRVAELTARAAEVEIRVDLKGATIEFDGRLVGEAPLAKPLRVAPGVHALRVTAPGLTPRQQSVVVNPADRYLATVNLIGENDSSGHSMLYAGEMVVSYGYFHACGCEVPGAGSSRNGLSALATTAAALMAARGRRRRHHRRL